MVSKGICKKVREGRRVRIKQMRGPSEKLVKGQLFVQEGDGTYEEPNPSEGRA